MRLLMLGACALAIATANSAAATTIGFDDKISQNGSALNPVVEDGYRFQIVGRGADALFAWGVSSPNLPLPGNPALLVNWPQGTVRVSRVDGGRFDFGSVKLADIFNGRLPQLGAPATDNAVVFAFSDGTSRTVFISGGAGYQTFDFGAKDLNWFTFTPTGTRGRGVQADDFVLNAVAAVPEPGLWATMILGFGLAGSALRRRRAAVI